MVDEGDQRAGSIRLISRPVKPKEISTYFMSINKNHTPPVQFVTIAHEPGHSAPTGLEVIVAVSATLPVNPPLGVSVMVEVFPVVAPGATDTDVPERLRLAARRLYQGRARSGAGRRSLALVAQPTRGIGGRLRPHHRLLSEVARAVSAPHGLGSGNRSVLIRRRRL